LVCKACGADKRRAPTKGCYKCGANRPKVKGRRRALRARKAEVPGQGAQDKSGELEKLRATLAATRKLAAEQGMSDVYESAISSLAAKVEALQAAKESTEPGCISEAAVTRKITFDERRKTKAEKKIVELGKKRDEVEKEITEQKERLQNPTAGDRSVGNRRRRKRSCQARSEATVTAGQAEEDIVVVLKAAGWTGPDAARRAKFLVSIAAVIDVDSSIVVKRPRLSP